MDGRPDVQVLHLKLVLSQVGRAGLDGIGALGVASLLVVNRTSGCHLKLWPLLAVLDMLEWTSQLNEGVPLRNCRPHVCIGAC